MAAGFFGLFVAFGSRIFLNCASSQLFLVSYCFFVFCSRRGVCRCKHCSRVPDSSLSHFHQRDSTPLFLKVRGWRSLLLKLLPAGQGPKTLAYSQDVEVSLLLRVPRTVGTWASLHWGGLNSLSHHEPYFKPLKPGRHELNQNVKQTRAKRNNNKKPWKGLKREGSRLTLGGEVGEGLPYLWTRQGRRCLGYKKAFCCVSIFVHLRIKV